jgi:hypothetical protein
MEGLQVQQIWERISQTEYEHAQAMQICRPGVDSGTIWYRGRKAIVYAAGKGGPKYMAVENACGVNSHG